MKEIKLNLTLEEVQYIANVIATRPYNECHLLIDKIGAQIKESVENDTDSITK